MKNNKKTQAILFILSGILLTISMPPFLNAPIIGFVGLSPAILAIRLNENTHKIFIMFFYGLAYTSISYSWYLDIFSMPTALLLIIAVAFWHSSLLLYGIKLEKYTPQHFKIFTLPIIYALLECLQRYLPFVREWWFIPYPKTLWGFPEGLWLLNITGITGVTFFLVLINNTLATLIHTIIENKKRPKIISLNLIACLIYIFIGFSHNHMEQPQNQQRYTISAISDMANELNGQRREGLYVRDAKIRDTLFQRNVRLTQTLKRKSDFVVWSENEFFNLNDKETIHKLENFSQQNNITLVVDGYIHNDHLYDTAVLIDPTKGFQGYTKKTYLFSDEINAGFIPSNEEPQVFHSKGTTIGMGVCYDFHFIDPVKALVKKKARIILMPRDDDMYRNALFPIYHATDAVFRAIEYGVVVASANTNGASIIVNPDGRIMAYSPVNTTSAIQAQVFITTTKTLYSQYGEWFAYTLAFILMLGIVRLIQTRNRVQNG
ncbi:MAG: hypothetical protein KGV48_001260 [Alcaligenaceae bacterium]|nr:hypothetical protein [Alcaligenaceae bacterium]